MRIKGRGSVPGVGDELVRHAGDDRADDGREPEHGWTTDQVIDRATKTFWSAVFGAVLISQAGFPGGPSSVDVAATLSLRLADEN